MSVTQYLVAAIAPPREVADCKDDASPPSAPSAEPLRAGPDQRKLRTHYTVLVVDDEEAVRRLAVRMLTRTGYQAIEAGHGREALAAFEQFSGSIHLVLTDIKMPGMSGRELGRQVEQRWPGTPILYMSGFASDVFEEGLLEPGVPFLAKPFTQDELAAQVGTLLGSLGAVYSASAGGEITTIGQRDVLARSFGIRNGTPLA